MMHQSIRLFGAAIISMALTTTTFGFMTVLDLRNGSSDDLVASGRVLDSGNGNSVIASWSLTSTVSATDFLNDAIQVGNSGVQYTMLNETAASADSNMLRFRVYPTRDNYGGGIVVSQSPYLSAASWNGGNEETAQFQLSWPSGTGWATIRDPDDLLAGIQDGQKIPSGTMIQFANDRVRNDIDTWKIDLPFRETEAHVAWSSANPNGNSTLTREWVNFKPNLGPVPEPGALPLMAMASLPGIGLLRRRKTPLNA